MTEDYGLCHDFLSYFFVSRESSTTFPRKYKRSAGCTQMRKEIICLRQIASARKAVKPSKIEGWELK